MCQTSCWPASLPGLPRGLAPDPAVAYRLQLSQKHTAQVATSTSATAAENSHLYFKPFLRTKPSQLESTTLYAYTVSQYWRRQAVKKLKNQNVKSLNRMLAYQESMTTMPCMCHDRVYHCPLSKTLPGIL